MVFLEMELKAFTMSSLATLNNAAKLDIVNAFNSISRKTIFESTLQLAPLLLPYLYTFYSKANPKHPPKHQPQTQHRKGGRGLLGRRWVMRRKAMRKLLDAKGSKRGVRKG